MKTALVWRRFGLTLALSMGLLGLSRTTVADDINNNGIPNVVYNAATGALSINPDNAQLISVLVAGPAATSINRWQNGTSGDGVNGWAQQYFNNKEQWVGAGSAVAGGFVTPVNSTYQIATYATGLTAADFGMVEIGAQDPANPPRGLTMFTTVTIETGPNPSACDFDNDGDCDAADLTALTRVGNLVTGVPQGNPAYQAKYDLTTDNVINGADISKFLTDAAAENGWAQPYYIGDTDLDGKVVFADFVNMNNNWQRTNLTDGTRVGWRDGDFNGDGRVDFTDFVAQNNNWQRMNTAAAAAAAVPEPSAFALVGVGLLGFVLRRRS